MGKSIRAAVIGRTIDALQAALYLAKIGTQVKFITDAPAFAFFESSGVDPRLFWSTVLNAIQDPNIEFVYNTSTVDICGGKGNFNIKTTQQLRYIDSDLCTGCKKCEENCSTRLIRQVYQPLLCLLIYRRNKRCVLVRVQPVTCKQKLC